MSASDWSKCPRCVKAAADVARERKSRLQSSYGKVDPEEYLRMAAEIEKPIKVHETLREDYEQGVDLDGVYYVVYRASCTQCDYEFTYKHEKQTDV